MKRLILIGGLIVIVLLGACSPEPPVSGLVEPVVEAPVDIAGLPADALGVFQGTIKFGTFGHMLSPGDVVDTWTELDETPVLGHKEGGPISLKIWNGYSTDVRVSVVWIPSDSYVDRVQGTDVCLDSDGEYTVAPDYVKDWFTFEPGEYILPSRRVLDIPLYLNVPKDASIRGKYIIQLGIVRVPDTALPMGLVEGYIFKLKLDIG